MNRFLIPLILMLMVVLLLSFQCTITWRWPIWDVRMELLPALLLYAAFSLNLSSAIILGIVSAGMYDSFSGGYFAASLIPYFVAITIFSALRPIFFRDRMTTQLMSGFVFAWIVLSLQWILSGKFSIGWAHAVPKIFRLAVLSGILSVVYFFILDRVFRLIDLEPGRFENS
jgi:hypothetical protein